MTSASAQPRRGGSAGTATAGTSTSGYGWHKHEPSRAEVEAYAAWGSNVGLRGDRFPALDIDCHDEKLVRRIRAMAFAHFGGAPVRVGKAPKELLVYRLEGEPFGRIGVKIEDHLVEILGSGRQYLVYGTHPSGAEYTWLGSPLWELDPSKLAVITKDSALAFMEEIAAQFGGEIQGRASISSVAVAQDDLLSPSIESLSDLVEQLKNDYDDRDDYILFGHAVKAAAGEHEEEGYAIFSEWAARWEGTNDPDIVRADWRRMQPPYRVGWGWLVDRAYEEEADFMEAEHIFQPDPDYEPPPQNPNIFDDDAVTFGDDWLAERLVPDISKQLRYDYPNDRWHIWDGARWASATMGEQERTVMIGLRRLAAKLRAKAQALPDGKDKDRLFKTIARLGNVGTLTSVTRMLQSHPRIVVGTDAFDQNLWELNTPGGTVDLTTGVLKDHQRESMHSKSTTETPRPGGHPLWSKFLDEVTRSDRDLQRYMQKLCGYALTGSTKEQTLNFVWGPGGNGKGVFLNTVVTLLDQYAATAPMDTFASSKGDKHPTDLAGLMGARLVTASETQAGRSWDEQRVKALTGGDKIRARFMRQDFVEFQPRFKLLLIGNHEPQIENVDEAMRRRIHMVPFTFTPPTRDLDLEEKLRAEHAQILQWMIDGCLLWQQEGLTPPEVVLARTQEYFEEEDRPSLWLAACTEPGPYMTSADAYKSWQLWCNEMGEHAGTHRDFTRMLRPHAAGRGYTYGKVGPRENRARGWLGVQLIQNPNEIQGEI
jgi:P4 family phage/plasmid primase-like protien